MSSPNVITRPALPHNPFVSVSPDLLPLPDDLSLSSMRLPLFSPVNLPDELSNEHLIQIFVRHPATHKHFSDGINQIKDLYTRIFLEVKDLLPKEGVCLTPTITAIKQQAHDENPRQEAFNLFAKPFLGYGVTGPIHEGEVPADGLAELLNLQVKIFKFALNHFTSEDPRLELLDFCARYNRRSTFPLLEIQTFLSRYDNYGKIFDFFFGDNTSSYGSPTTADPRHFTPIDRPLRSFSVFERATPIESPEKKVQEILTPALAEIARLWSYYFSKEAVTQLFLEVTK
jgi:hypothetical protein